MSLPTKPRRLPDQYDPRQIEAAIQDILTAQNQGFQFVRFQEMGTEPTRTVPQMVVVNDSQGWDTGAGRRALHIRTHANTAWRQVIDIVPGTETGSGNLVYATSPSLTSASLTGVKFVPTVANPADGFTVTLTNTDLAYCINGAAVKASLTVNLPSTGLVNGEVHIISTRSAITTFTVGGGTIYGAPTTLAAGGKCGFVYAASPAAWFSII